MGLFAEEVWIRILSRVVDNKRTDIKAASCVGSKMDWCWGFILNIEKSFWYARLYGLLRGNLVI